MPRKRTHDEYVALVAALDKGFTVVGEYVNGTSKITHRCAKGHEWDVTPKDILSGNGCPDCFNANRGNAIRKTHADYVAQVDALGKGITVVGEYVGDKTKITHRCPKGHEWDVTPNSILQGRGCFHCNSNPKRTHSEYVALVDALGKGISVVGEYVGAHTKITHKCDRGHYWETTPSRILNENRGCPKCAGVAKKSHADYASEVEASGRGIEVVDQYKGNKKAIRHKCKKGHIWLAKPNNILSGQSNCPDCAHNKKTSHAEYVRRVSELNNGIEVIGRYLSRHKKVLHQCDEGHRWEAVAGSILAGHGCPHCDRIASDANVFYIWENTQDPGVYKVGITSERCADERIAICSRKNGMTANVILMAATPNARDIERRALELGDDPRYPDTIDGYTEFRRYSDAELGEVWRMAVGA